MQVGKEGKRVWRRWVSRMGEPISDDDLREARAFFEELYLYGIQGKQLPSNIKAGAPLTSDERMAHDAGFKDRTGSTMMGETDSKKEILRRCMREAGYSVRPEMAPEEGGIPVTEARVLTFDFIEDDRFGGSKRALMEKDRRLKKLVNVVREGNIRPLHFSGVDGPSRQWRKKYWVARSGTETWEDVMGKINSIQASPYKFARIGLPKGLAGELGGVGLPQIRISDPIQWDNSEWVVTEHGAVYPWQYGHVGNTPIYIRKDGRWVSYFDRQKIVSLPDVFEQEYLKTKRGLPTALSPMHSPAGGVSRAEREKLLKIIGSISETLTDEAWGVLHDDYIRLSQAVSDLAFENKLGPRRREKITLALNRFANAYHGHYKAPYTPDKAEMTEALAVVEEQVRRLG